MKPNNPAGHPATLIASHPGHTNSVKHGIYSPRVLAPRALEVAEALMALPHVIEPDRLAAEEVGRLQALVEALDAALAEIDLLKAPVGRVNSLTDMRLRASRRLMEAIDRFGATPLGRAKWARELAEGESLADTLRRRREAPKAS